jgi:hypothetical protein
MFGSRRALRSSVATRWFMGASEWHPDVRVRSEPLARSRSEAIQSTSFTSVVKHHLYRHSYVQCINVAINNVGHNAWAISQFHIGNDKWSSVLKGALALAHNGETVNRSCLLGIKRRHIFCPALRTVTPREPQNNVARITALQNETTLCGGLPKFSGG